jgi:hypothetical protein
MTYLPGDASDMVSPRTFVAIFAIFLCARLNWPACHRLVRRQAMRDVSRSAS